MHVWCMRVVCVCTYAVILSLHSDKVEQRWRLEESYYLLSNEYCALGEEDCECVCHRK